MPPKNQRMTYYGNKYFSDIVSWRSILLVDATGIPGENHMPHVTDKLYPEADLEGGVRPPKIRKAYVIQR
jgi:hypothetical protein